MSPAEFARLRGVSRQAVMVRIAAGSLPSAAKVGGRWQIDAEKATQEWGSLTRTRIVDAHHNGDAPPDKLYPTFLASCELVSLAIRIEKCHDAIFAEMLKAAPDFQTRAWPALDREWANMPDALEKLQHALYEAGRQ